MIVGLSAQEDLSYLPLLMKKKERRNVMKYFWLISLAALDQLTFNIILCITECIIKCTSNGNNKLDQHSRDLGLMPICIQPIFHVSLFLVYFITVY